MSSINNRLASKGIPLYTPSTSATSQVGDTSTQAATDHPVAKTKATVNLFEASTFQTTQSSANAQGSAPALSDDEAAQAQDLFAQVPDEHKDAVNAASTQLGQALFAQLYMAKPAQVSTDDDGSESITGVGGMSRIAAGGTASVSSDVASTSAEPVSGLQAPSLQSKATSTGTTDTPVSVTKASPAVVAATQSFASTYASATGTSSNADGAVMATAYAGVVGLQNELTTYAGNLSNTTSLKSSYDSDYEELSDAIASWPSDADSSYTESLPYVDIGADGTVTVTESSLTKAQAQTSMQAASDAAQNTGSDQQVKMIQLQQMQQNYSNAINMISNIMKAGYDTEKNTLGNIHY